MGALRYVRTTFESLIHEQTESETRTLHRVTSRDARPAHPSPSAALAARAVRRHAALGVKAMLDLARCAALHTAVVCSSTTNGGTPTALWWQLAHHGRPRTLAAHTVDRSVSSSVRVVVPEELDDGCSGPTIAPAASLSRAWRMQSTPCRR